VSMRDGGAEERSALAERRARTFGAVILVAGLLVVTWPFMRTPPFGLIPAYLHLVGAWVAIIAALVALSRALARHPGDDGDE
jgi:hypothetical protein